MKIKSFNIKAVLFDFDGTLTKPGAIDFALIRKAIGCPPEKPILEYIEKLKDKKLQKVALKTLDHFEMQAAINSKPNSGSEELIHYLRSKRLPIGIISRNSRQSIRRALKNFNHIAESDFDLIISRDDPVKPKPSADGILLAARKLKVAVKELLLVGDFIFDIQAGNKAGAITVFLSNGKDPKSSIPESHFVLSHLSELRDIIRLGQTLPAGKLPNDLLGKFIGQLNLDDPAVIINPGVGEDVAAMDVVKEEVLVLKSDPITFVTDSIGHYAVLINANDIATSGAIPRWFLTSLLFPCGTTASGIWEVMHELQNVCQQWGISLCGGHTEITDAVTRPVVTGMLAGTVKKNDLIDKRRIKPGDAVLLTKGVSVEGTAIIAREFGDRLKSLGMLECEIETCKQFLSQISIIKEARIASSIKGVSAMHDVTEGGLATALSELSIAASHKIEVDLDRIPIFPQTQQICRLLGIDPLGLIGSGSLLICCRKKYVKSLMAKIQDVEISVSNIGEVLRAGEGVEVSKRGKKVKWPCFEVDEITRLFQKRRL